MKKFLLCLMIAGLCCGMNSLVLADATDTENHTVTITVGEITLLDINGGNVTITVNEANVADAGGLPADQTDVATSLDWTSNIATETFATGRAITAQLSVDMPTGLVLKAAMAEPTTKNTGAGATAGEKTLALATAVTMYDGIANENCLNAVVTYKTHWTAMVSHKSYPTTVTWTLADDD